MKICFLEIQPFPYNIGGGTTHLIDLSKYLIKKGHEVSIITSKAGNNQKPLALDKRFRVYAAGMPHKIFKKNSLFSSIYNVFYRFLWEISWVIAAQKKLRELNPDICNPQSLITTALPCSLSGREYVATQHGVYLDGFRKLWKERRSKIVLGLSKIYEKIENFNAKRARYITCVSKETYEYYKKFGKAKCSIITHGIDPDNFKDVDFSKKRDYLFMGRLTEQKGVSYLIDALEILDKQKIKLTINIAGDGEKSYVEPLKKKADSFRYVKVNFLGFVIGKKRNELYKKASVFISSSIFEPFGIVLAEALASGCAIISANHEGGRLMVKPSIGKLVNFDLKDKRIRSLAEAIKESLKWNTKKMGKAALEESKKYSYDNLSDKYIEIFQEIANNE